MRIAVSVAIACPPHGNERVGAGASRTQCEEKIKSVGSSNLQMHRRPCPARSKDPGEDRCAPRRDNLLHKQGRLSVESTPGSEEWRSLHRAGTSGPQRGQNPQDFHTIGELLVGDRTGTGVGSGGRLRRRLHGMQIQRRRVHGQRAPSASHRPIATPFSQVLLRLRGGHDLPGRQSCRAPDRGNHRPQVLLRSAYSRAGQGTADREVLEPGADVVRWRFAVRALRRQRSAILSRHRRNRIRQ